MILLPLFIFWGLWFLNFSTRAIFAPLLPLIEDTLAVSHGEAGGLFTSLSMGYALTLILAGRFAFLWGYKRTVVAGYIGIGLVFFLMQWAESYLSFHLLFFLLGIATGTYLPSILPIISETYDYRHWGRVIGFHDSAASLSILSIPIVVAFGLPFLSWKTLLLILGIISMFFPFFFWKVSVEPKQKASEQRSGYWDILRRREVWVLGILWIFAAGSCLGIYSILPLYLVKERGIDFNLANTLFGVSRLGGVFASLLSGFLTDRYGYPKMLVLSLLTTGLSTLALSLSSTIPSILVTLILQATLSLIFFPAGLTAISNLTRLSERSMVVGLIISFGVIFGMGLTPFLLGVIADRLNFQTGIFGMGVLTTLSTFGVRFLRKKEPSGG